MRFLSLHLLAYGPFTDVRLDLGGADTGFHVIFGANEAGKSSALRALTALLYGVPERTPDTFVHEGSKLRIGGHLRLADGRELVFLRRKGRKNTLLDPKGKALLGGALGPFLAGVDRDRFRTVFGIDHQRLAQGAQAILRGGGDVGQSLFAAGLGGVNARALLQRLEDEASRLYRPRASKPSINHAISEYRAATRRIAESAISGRDWSEQRDALERLRQERHLVDEQMDGLHTETTRLKRLLDALPRLARRRELRDELSSLADVAHLAGDFTQRRRSAQEVLRQAGPKLERDTRLRAELQQRMDRLQVPAGLLEQKVAIDDLHRKLGSIRKGGEDATRLQARQKLLRRDAHILLQELRPDVELDAVNTIRPRPQTRARVRELAERYQAVEAAPAGALRQQRRCERDLEEARKGLAALQDQRDGAPLRATVDRIRKRGDLEADAREAQRALEGAREEAQVGLAALQGWSGSLAEAASLPVPTRETIGRFQEAFREGQSRAHQLDEVAKDRQQRLDAEREKMEELRLAGAAPTETDLNEARERRGEGWGIVRRAWLEQEDVQALASRYDPQRDLAAAYEHSVEQADELADRLRREAGRVARFAEIQAARSRLEGELQQARQAREALGREMQVRQEAWSALWAPLGIHPLPPAEMQAWMRRHEGVVQRAAAVRQAEQRLQALRQEIVLSRSALSSALTALGDPPLADTDTLEAGLGRAQRLVDTLLQGARSRQELEQRVPRLERELEEAREGSRVAAAALADWRRDWQAAVADLGLAASASPAEANAVLDKFDELFEKMDKARDLQGRLEGIQRDAQGFKEQVVALVRRVAPDLEGRPSEHAVEELHARLAAATHDAATLKEIRQHIADLNLALADHEQDIRQAREEVAALCQQARCASPDGLEAAERRWARHQELEQKLQELDDRLAELGRGKTADALEQEVRDVDPDALPGRVDELERQRGDLETRRTELDREIGRRQGDLARIDGDDAAASAATLAQGLLAGLHVDVERYVRLRLASELLRREIELPPADRVLPVEFDLLEACGHPGDRRLGDCRPLAAGCAGRRARAVARAVGGLRRAARQPGRSTGYCNPQRTALRSRTTSPPLGRISGISRPGAKQLLELGRSPGPYSGTLTRSCPL